MLLMILGKTTLLIGQITRALLKLKNKSLVLMYSTLGLQIKKTVSKIINNFNVKQASGFEQNP